MKIGDIWWSAPTESHSGKTVFVTGRDGVDPLRESGEYPVRVDVEWHYAALPDGMPEQRDAELMEAATEALKKIFADCRIAVMTGIYTGDGERNWVFYVRKLRMFGALCNKALCDLDAMPLLIEAEDDDTWEEYLHMRELTYIPDED